MPPLKAQLLLEESLSAYFPEMVFTDSGITVQLHRNTQMADGSVAWNRKISRQKLLHTLRQFPPQTLIAMEACSTSHFWGRTLISMGYDVKLIPTQHVKAFARHQKNDANDALAICETACRPGIHFVSVKTTEQQDIKALRSAHMTLAASRCHVKIRTVQAYSSRLESSTLQSTLIASQSLAGLPSSSMS